MRRATIQTTEVVEDQPTEEEEVIQQEAEALFSISLPPTPLVNVLSVRYVVELVIHL